MNIKLATINFVFKFQSSIPEVQFNIVSLLL